MSRQPDSRRAGVGIAAAGTIPVRTMATAWRRAVPSRGTLLRMTELRVRSAYLRVATRRSTPPRPVVPTTRERHPGEHVAGALAQVTASWASRCRPPETGYRTRPNPDNQLNDKDQLTGPLHMSAVANNVRRLDIAAILETSCCHSRN